MEAVQRHEVSPVLDEKELYPHISNFFLDRGYFVISGCKTKKGLEGTSEFGFTVNGQPMRSDITAARWDDKYQIEAIAVECKRLGTINRSLGAGLWQAINYQVAFDKVFIATEASGRALNMSSVIHSLGIGHITVDIGSGKCQVISNEVFRNIDRFDESVRGNQVIPRLVLFLAFRDVLGIPLRYGETFDGGGYIAKNIAMDVQYSAWIDKNVGDAYFGINIEHIDSFRRLLRSMDWHEFQICLKNLKGHDVNLVKDPVPKGRSKYSEKILERSASNMVDAVVVKKEIETVINDLPRKWRPHLEIHSRLWKGNETLFRDTYLSRIKSAKDDLSATMEVLIAGVKT